MYTRKEVHSLPEIETPMTLHYRNVIRLRRCLYTLKVIEEQMFDPIDLDDRADLLLLAEEIAGYAIGIANTAREITWQDADESAPEGADN